MCGIAGIRSERRDPVRLRELATGMTRRLAHRGPDSDGIWVDAQAGIALGHTRLAVIDLTPGGHQPMRSRCGRYVITYNGEIYNYEELAHDVTPGGTASSDTAVLLDCLSAWGLETTLQRVNGMFAFGLWDRATETLSLVTDRMGEKPLYHARAGADVIFASELKSLAAHDGFTGEVDDDSLALYLLHGYVPAPRSIHKGVFKLEPGSVATYRRGAAADVRRYWSPPAPQAARPAQDPRAAVDALDGLLTDSVRLRLRSDVPLGVFFSGGIDSTAVLAHARRVSTGRLTAFTIGFEDAAFNEAVYAKQVAEHLDCDYVQTTVTPREALAIIPSLSTIYDEPFGDASSVPTCLLAAWARKHVTVALAGDGGDELFGGYWRYQWAKQLWPAWGQAPALVRTPASRLLAASASVTGLLPGLSRFATRAGRLAQCLATRDTLSLNRQLTAQPDAEQLLIAPPAFGVRDDMQPRSCDHLIEQLMALDVRGYLPNDILVKTDRATMAVALEARLPFLDYRIVEWGLSLPIDLRLRGSVGKWVLREALYRHVPQSLLDRPKQGFALPVAGWLRGPLRDWAEDLLSVDRLRDQPLLDVTAIRRQWTQHLAGRRDWRHSLWPLLMFLDWQRASRDYRVSAAQQDNSYSISAGAPAVCY